MGRRSATPPNGPRGGTPAGHGGRFCEGFAAGYERREPRTDDDEYDNGYVEGGFARLEGEQPGISEAMSYEFTAAKFSPDDAVLWLRSDPKARFYGESGEFRPD